jgi:drug/metabolite transporter (DMT)-like permease
VATVLAGRDGVGLNTLMAWRYVIATPLLFLLAGGAAFRVPPRQVLSLLLLGGAGQSAVTWLSLSALGWLPAAAVGFLFYTYPAWVAVMAAVFGLERLTGLRVLALGIALAGITLMVGAPWQAALPFDGVWRALGAALVYAAYIPVVHRLRGSLSAAAAASWIIGGAALVFVALAVREGGIVTSMTAIGWGVAGVLALFSTVVAYLTFLRGLAVLGPVRTAILSTTEPFFTAVLAAVILAQPIGPATILGGGCIIVAILLLQRPVPRSDAAPLTTTP